MPTSRGPRSAARVADELEIKLKWEGQLWDDTGKVSAEASGHVLIPAFAVGRAQEVLLALRGAMERGAMPAFPVYADGMVRAVCGVYRHHPPFLQKGLRRRALREGRDLFFPERSSFAPIRSADERRAVIEGPPACVVASSGMLAGGASPLYAREWAGEPSSLIAITGYQDEEAPGRALLDLADGRRRTLSFSGAEVEVRCRVERYQLSAHADADEIVGLLSRMRPRSVYVVHGDERARSGLGARLESSLRGRIELPADGELLPLGGARRRRRRSWEGPGIGGGRDLDEVALEELREHFLRAAEAPRRQRVEELAEVWFGEEPTPEQVGAMRGALEGSQSAFAPDRGLAFRFRPRPATSTGPIPAEAVFEAVDRLLPASSSGLCKRSAHRDERRVVLRFDFPDVQGPAAAEAIRAIEELTGWRVEVHPHPRQERLVEAALEQLAPEARGAARVSVLHDEKRVRLRCPAGSADPGVAREEFQRRTGWRLELEEGPAESGTGPRDAQAAGLSPQEARREALAAFAEVEEPLAPLKLSFPAGRIVLHFVHPGLAEQHAERMAALAARTGLAVEPHPHPVQQRLVELVRELVPRDWEQMKPPAYVPQQEAVRVTVWSRPAEAEVERVRDRVRRLLGCGVVVVEED